MGAISLVIVLTPAGSNEGMGAGASLGLFHAADAGDIQEVSKAVSSGVDVNEKEKSSRQTPLMAACRGGHKEVVLILLKAGAYVKRAMIFSRHCVLFVHGESIVSYFAAGADPNSRDSLNQTALHFTAAAPLDKCHNVPDMLAALVKHKADVAVKDTEGATLQRSSGPESCSLRDSGCCYVSLQHASLLLLRYHHDCSPRQFATKQA